MEILAFISDFLLITCKIKITSLVIGTRKVSNICEVFGM